MSLNSALQAGVSGLTANSTALSTISNNIANVNTVGFKQGQTDFESLVTASGGDAAAGSGGVMATTQQLIGQQGAPLTESNSPLDLAISGQGFFVTTTQATNLTPTDPRLFTRAGAFTVNSQGYLVNSAGLVLQGWPADATGTITPNPSDLSSLKSINVSQVGGAVEATTIVGVNGNLNSSQPISAAAAAFPAGAGAYNPATNSMAMFETNPATGVKPDYSIQIPISDSQGGQHTIQIDFLKSSTPDQWFAEVVAVPASDVVDGAGLSNGQIATGTVAFTPTGQIDPANTTLFGGGAPTITFGASNAAAPGAGQVNWSAALGVAAQTVTVNIAGGAGIGGLTQLDSQSVTQSINTNGTAFGNLSGVQVDKNGVVTEVFSNGVTRTIAQIAIATFPNPDGLTPQAGDAFQVSQNSGLYTLEQAGTGGAGQIAPFALEGSTVDLSQQLTDLITTQSAYSASSKIITTANQMMQALLNIVQ